MRSIIVAAILGGLTLPAAGYAKCRFGIEEAGHIETKRSPWKAKAIQALHSKLGNRDGELYLLTIYQSMGKKVEFNDETPLELIFANGDSTTLTPEDPGSSRRTLLGLAINNRKAETAYFLNRESFEQFRSMELVRVRMHFEHDGVADVEEFEIGRRNRERFMEYAACVLDYPQ